MDNSNHIREKNRRLAKNTLFMYFMTASIYILNLATIPYLTRILGPSVYGQIGLAIGYMTYIQIILDFGFILSATQKISQHREDKQYISEIVMSVSFIKTLLSVISMTVLFLFYKIGFIEQAVMKLLFVYMFAYVFSALLPDYFYRGIENMKTISIRTVIIKVIFTVLVFVFVKGKEDVIFVPVSVLIGNLCALVFSIIDIRKNYEIKISKLVWNKIYSIFRESIPFFVSRFASTFYQALNVIIFGRIYGSSDLVGYYTTCDKIIALAKTGSSPIADSLYPYMLENKNYRLIKKLLLIVMPVITIGVVLVGIFAEPVCVFLFGAEYREAGTILRLMLPIAWVILPTYIIAFPVMSPLGLVKYANISNVIGMLFQIFGLILLFLLKEFNIYTICFLASLTEIIVFIYRLMVVLIFLKRRRKH